MPYTTISVEMSDTNNVVTFSMRFLLFSASNLDLISSSMIPMVGIYQA